MIKRTYEWYQIVNANPPEETIRARKLAVESLIKKIDDSEDHSLLIGCAAGVVNGFADGSTNQDAVTNVLSSIQDHQQAFPSDLAKNELELRVCASIAVGEIITRETDEESSNDDAILASAVLTSGLSLRPDPQEQYMRAMLNELKDVSHTANENAAMTQRVREDLDLSALSGEAPADVPAAWKTLGQFLKTTFEQLENQARNDREELNVIWWLYGNYSEVGQKQVSNLKPYEAAFCVGKEIADLTQVPSYESVRQMVTKATEANRRTESLKASRLDLIVKQWNEREMRSLIPEETQGQDFVRLYPAVVPLTWLVARIIDSGVKNSWAEEFEKKTGRSSSSEFTPGEIARQVFDERMMQRIYEELA